MTAETIPSHRNTLWALWIKPRETLWVPALAILSGSADIRAGRLAVDEPLANRVRSGRKQP
jgi:hypothetical protein